MPFSMVPDVSQFAFPENITENTTIICKDFAEKVCLMKVLDSKK